MVFNYINLTRVKRINMRFLFIKVEPKVPLFACFCSPCKIIVTAALFPLTCRHLIKLIACFPSIEEALIIIAWKVVILGEVTAL